MLVLIFGSCHPTEGPTEKKTEETENPTDGFYQQALAGFILVMTEEGDMIFLSESVSKYIGITQVSVVPTY